MVPWLGNYPFVVLIYISSKNGEMIRIFTELILSG
jgi:hypothetical protein